VDVVVYELLDIAMYWTYHVPVVFKMITLMDGVILLV